MSIKKSFLDLLFETPQAYGMRISPDCKWVAWSWKNLGPTANVFISPTDGSKKPIQITDTDQDVDIYSWSFDSKSLIVGHDTDGDEKAKLFRIDLNNPRKLYLLTDKDPEYFIRGGVLHPDKQSLIYGANFDFEKNKVTEQTSIYRQDLINGERKVLVTPNKSGNVNPQLNSKGTHIIYTRNDIHPSGKQIWIVDVNGKEDKEILNSGDESEVSASWSPNGEMVIFLADFKTFRKVGIWHLQDASIEWLINDKNRNIEDAYIPYGSTDVVIVEIKEAITKISLYNIKTKEEKYFSAPQTCIPLAQLSSNKWVVAYYNSIQPIDIVIYDSEKKGIEKTLAGIWEKVFYKQEDLVRTEDFRWKSNDGMEIQGWLYCTKIPSKGTLVDVHGGPTTHEDDSFRMSTQYYVSEGFNVFKPNYRGSTGFGLKFQESIKKEGWGGSEQVDIISGIKALIEKGIATPHKVGITGTSYGGYSSWFAITHAPIDLVAASAPICGMTDLVVDYETTRPDLRNYSEAMMGGTPKTASDRYYERSPIHFVKNIKGNLLIIQGARDPNVTLENVDAVRNELDKHAIPYDVLIFDDEGHGISKPKNQKQLYQKLVEFFSISFTA